MKNMKLWTHPENYYGEVWPNYYVFLTRHRDSDLLTECNFDVAMERLKALPHADEYENSRIIVREGHFAVGWIEWIAIHADDTDAIQAAEEMEKKIETCCILDEDRYCEMESREADRVWKENYNTKERIQYIRDHDNQFEFQSFADMRQCIKGEYFSGYACELIQ